MFAHPDDEVDPGPATAHLDVSDFVAAKVDAISAYRSQYSLKPGMLPEPILREIYGQEYFVQVLPPRRSLDTELYGWWFTPTRCSALITSSPPFERFCAAW